MFIISLVLVVLQRTPWDSSPWKIRGTPTVILIALGKGALLTIIRCIPDNETAFTVRHQ